VCAHDMSVVLMCVVYGVWCVMCGVWRVACGVWCVMCGVMMCVWWGCECGHDVCVDLYEW